MAGQRKTGFTVLGTLWRAVRQARRPGAPGLGAMVSAVPRMLSARLSGAYSAPSLGRLAAMALAVGYVLAPIDVMPELFLLVFGFADDLIVLTWFVAVLLDEAERFLGWERERHSAAAVSDRHRVIGGEVLYESHAGSLAGRSHQA